jgi:hypothetical protein
MKLTLLLLSLLFGSVVFGQGSGQYLIAVGATQGDVRAHLGSPSMLYSPDTKKFVPVQTENALLAAGFRIEDVYERPGSNEFRVTVWYDLDSSSSRLHPVERVNRVDFVADRSEPYKTLLSRIPEVVSLCRSGCEVEGQIVGDAAEILVCRAPKSGEERLIMQSAANGWQEPSPNPWQWCVDVFFNGQYAASGKGGLSLPWDGLSVDRVAMGPGMLPSKRELFYKFENAKERLGTWVP